MLVKCVRGACLGGVAIAAVVASSAHAGIVIDEFSAVADPNPWPVELTSVGSQNVTETGVANVLNNERNAEIAATSLKLPGIDRIAATVGSGVFDFQSSLGAQGSATLSYGPVDLSNEGAFVLKMFDFDMPMGAPLDITVSMFDGANTATLVASVTGSGDATYAFADFANIGTVDLAAVQELAFELESGAGVDYRIGSIETLPIPAPGLVTMIALGGIAATRRRRRG